MAPATIRTADLADLPPAAVDAHRSFLTASASGPVVERRYTIAGQHVQMLFAGSDVAATLAPAFSHLVTGNSSTPDLTIFLSDAASSGTPPIALPESGDAPGTWLVHEGPDVHWGRQVGVDGLTVLSSRHRAAWFWAPDVTELPLFERAAPLRILWHWWLPLRSRGLIHAAAVGNGAAGVLLVGRGGSGKSTAALASVGHDLLYAADDYVAASVDPPMVYSIYNSGKIDTDNARRLPHLEASTEHHSAGHPFDTNKTVVFLAERFGTHLTSSFPLTAIMVPRITNAGPGTTLVPARSAEALLALAPSTVLQMPGGGDTYLSWLTALAGAVPTFRLEMGTDLGGVAETIAAFLDDPPSGP
jgi:hypothetical protein